MARAIHYHSQKGDLRLNRRKMLSDWLTDVVLSYGKTPGDINYIYCTDRYLLQMNKQYLGHDDYTDVITFDYCDGDMVSGDILISTDRVRENAQSFGGVYEDELHRVMVHGLLHLLGLKDKTAPQISQMRSAEDHWLQNRGNKSKIVPRGTK